MKTTLFHSGAAVAWEMVKNDARGGSKGGIHWNFYLHFFFKVFADNSVDVELCQTLGVIGLKESTV